jgi:N-succinyldiaminopimelate aminotransferase
VNGSPFQPAIARGLDLPRERFDSIARDLRGKRDVLTAGLRAAGFDVSVPSGSYFTIADAAAVGFDDAVDLCQRLPELAGVVGVPVTAFTSVARRAEYRSLVRFAFCKRLDVLEEASARLAAMRP